MHIKLINTFGNWLITRHLLTAATFIPFVSSNSAVSHLVVDGDDAKQLLMRYGIGRRGNVACIGTNGRQEAVTTEQTIRTVT